MNEVFFPSKNWIGVKNKDKGLYFKQNGINFVRNEGFKRVETLIPYTDIASIQHFAKFTFLFLIFVYRIQVLNMVAIVGKQDELLIPLKIGEYDLNSILQICIELTRRVQNISLDETIREAVQKNSKQPITNNYLKAVWNGLKWWIIIFLVFIGLIIFAGLFSK